MNNFSLVKRIAVVLCLGGAIFLESCQEPVPLYGTWADNRGNKLSFYDDGSYLAMITYPGFDRAEVYQGSWSILQNSLTLTCPDLNLQIVSEWDIRGNMLYMQWAALDKSMSLTLYKISD
jgi:hypothetical protein